MKNQLTVILLAFALALTMTGCAAADAARRLDAAEDRVEARLDAAEERLEDSLRQAVTPAESAANSRTEMPLTEEQAVQIALDHLGLTVDRVDRLRSGYEVDDGILQFDVELLYGDWEYEFEIHGETGQILSFDKDHRYD